MLESAVRAPSQMIAIGDAYVGAVTSGRNSDPNALLSPYNSGAAAAQSGTIQFDVFGSHGNISREDPQPEYFPVNQGGKLGKTAYTRHSGRLNMLFCDGHVEALRVQALFFSKDDRDLRLWNSDNEPHRDRLYKSPH